MSGRALASTASRGRRGTPQKLRCRRERATTRKGSTKHLTTATTQARTELRAHRLTDARAVPRAELQPNRGPHLRAHPFANIRTLGRAEPAADAPTVVKTNSGAVLRSIC